MPKATKAENTSRMTMPVEIANDIMRKMQERSVIASLCPARPTSFVNEKHLLFTVEPEAEYVGEGEAKSSAEFKFEPLEGKRHKVQTTVRMTDEYTWADEDAQTGILTEVFDSMAGSFSRALDYGMIHALNPLTQEVLESLKPDALAYIANQITATGNAQTDIDNLPDSILGKYDVTGIALDRMYANELRKIRNPNTGAKVFPEVNLSLDPGNLDGLRAVTSGAVSGSRFKLNSGIQAIMGDWNLIRYGIVRDFGLTEIRFGDPDGLGDLQRYNQVAFRVETVFSWVNFDPTGFAVLRSKASSGSDSTGGGSDSTGGDTEGDDTETETQSAKSARAAK